MAAHILKISPKHFKDVKTGKKKAELRMNDRNYQIGDVLLLREYLLDTDKYTGSSCQVKITHILDITALMCIAGNHTILSIEIIAK